MSRIERCRLRFPPASMSRLTRSRYRKGKLGTLEQKMRESDGRIRKQYYNRLHSKRKRQIRAGRGDNALWVSPAPLSTNMVIGVSEGYQKKLEIVGVGYNAQKNGKLLL